MNCPACKSDKVLMEKTDKEDINTYLCLRCGYTAHDAYTRKSDGDLLKNTNYSKIIESLSFFESEDENARKWYPSVFVHENGMLYPDGENEFSWNWVFVPIVKLTEEEKKDDQYRGFESRMAMEQKITYDRYEFGKALKNFGDISEELGI